MDLHSLQLFLDLAHTLKFRATARRRHLTPSALSRAISRLESELNHPLFDRTRRSVRLTPAGHRLLPHAQRTLAEFHALLSASADTPADLRGSLSLYCSVTSSYTLLPTLLTRLRRHHPGISLHITTGDVDSAPDRVSSGESDLAIAILPDLPPKNLTFAKLAESPLIFIASPDFSLPFSAVPHARVSLRHWQSIPLILPESGSARREVERFFKRHHLKPTIASYVTGNEAILSLASLGLGVGVVPQLVFDHRPSSLHLRTLPNAPTLKPYTATLCARTRALKENPLLQAAFSSATSTS